jgi:hypothetical protein
MRTLRGIPDRVPAPLGEPRSVRNATMLAPTIRRARSQDDAGLFWLGRVGTSANVHHNQMSAHW